MNTPQIPEEPTKTPKNLLERIKQGSLRTQLLVVVGVVVALMLWGPLRGCSGVTVSKDEAIAAARAQVDFEPERTDVRQLRQGWSSTHWIVVFTVSDPDIGPEALLRHTEVRVHAGTGELLDVVVHVP